MIYKVITQFSDIITSYDVKRYYQFESSSGIVIDFYLLSGHKLFIKEYLFSDESRKYSYHFQNNKDEIIFPYDNAPHWNKFDNFPHHKHSDDQVYNSKSVSIEDSAKYGIIS